VAKIGLIFDGSSMPYLREGAIPRTSMSHDFNLFQIAHQALSKGHEVYFGSNSDYHCGGNFGRLVSIYPRLSFMDVRATLDEIAPEALYSNHIQIFAGGQYPAAKKVAIHPALYFVEMPYLYNANQTREQLHATREHVDFILVQNQRMKEILMAFYGWLAGWSEADRILVNPLGIVTEEEFNPQDRMSARAVLHLSCNDISIVNGGGIWRWTGFNDFLRGFIASVRNGADNLVLVMSGFRQDENEDHGAYIDETRRILSANADIVGNRMAVAPEQAAKIRIHVENDWNDASQRLHSFLAGADFGLNVNQDGLENWQAQRVRCLEYTKYGLPLLTTPGDFFSDSLPPGGLVRLPSSDPSQIAEVLTKLSANPDIASSARAITARVRHDIITSRTTLHNLEYVLRTAKRTIVRNNEVMLETYRRVEGEAVRSHAALRIADFLGLGSE
jgi:hypothetical protein